MNQGLSVSFSSSTFASTATRPTNNLTSARWGKKSNSSSSISSSSGDISTFNNKSVSWDDSIVGFERVYIGQKSLSRASHDPVSILKCKSSYDYDNRKSHVVEEKPTTNSRKSEKSSELNTPSNNLSWLSSDKIFDKISKIVKSPCIHDSTSNDTASSGSSVKPGLNNSSLALMMKQTDFNNKDYYDTRNRRNGKTSRRKKLQEEKVRSMKSDEEDYENFSPILLGYFAIST